MVFIAHNFMLFRITEMMFTLHSALYPHLLIDDLLCSKQHAKNKETLQEAGSHDPQNFGGWATIHLELLKTGPYQSINQNHSPSALQHQEHSRCITKGTAPASPGAQPLHHQGHSPCITRGTAPASSVPLQKFGDLAKVY